MSQTPATPLMRQYHAIKQQVPQALLMFRLGDFYELFYEDAVTAARELEITLTSRNKDQDDPVPMCGVPHHSAEGYIARLIQKGYRVAICEQMEDPVKARTIVRREVTRIVTPGTVTESGVLRSRENNFLAAVLRSTPRAGLAFVDVSTGEFRVTELPEREVEAALEQSGVREVLYPSESPAHVAAKAQNGALITEVDAWAFSFDYAYRLLKEHFRLLTLDGCGLADRHLAVSAAGAVLHYLRETQRATLDHLERPAYYTRGDAMVLDGVTVRNLELLDPLFSADLAAEKDATLIRVLDLTETGMGARLLRRRLLEPAMNRPEIEARLDAVEELYKSTIPRGEIRKMLAGIQDIERLLAKVTIGRATPRELLALGRSLSLVPLLKEKLARMASARLAGLHARLDEVAEARDRILTAIAEEPPANLADGGTIRSGYHAELDELRDLSRNSKQYLARIEVRERERTGIQSLKVRFNNVFGYYIEVSKANLHLVPADYDRKQTLVNAERFITPELKELEQKILEAEEKMLALERELFEELRSAVAAEAQRIRQTGTAIAETDATAALAEAASRNRYVRPRFSETGELRILAGRHPVIEKLTEREAQRFIPNDLYLDAKQFIALITGPNMGGKSTYLRQVALIAVMAQMGSYVPAESATLPVIDRIYTRIGASDNLARGRSTFMMEMTEAAVILNTATERSLIVLDEIGRGTATYDGLSLAWAIVEFVHGQVRAKTLFATHYHELTELAEQLEGVVNLSVSVREAGDQIVFLRRVEPGRADRSYGIEVARLAGLPKGVIERAREILAFHEKTEHTATEKLAKKPARAAPVQVSLFEPVSYRIADRIRGLSIDELRPLEALQILDELKRELTRE